MGCAAAEASGGACASGFAVAFGTEMVAGSLGNGFAPDPAASAADNEAARQAFEQNRAALVGALAGYVTSGGEAVNVSQGSSIARGAVTWNRQLHIKEAELIGRYAADFAAEQGYCESAESCSVDSVERAKAELTGETLRGVSDDFAHLDSNSAARAFLDGLASSADLLGPQVALNGQHMFGVLDRNSAEYRNSTINMGDLIETYDLYASIDKAAFHAVAAMDLNSDPDLYSEPLRPSALIAAALGATTDILQFRGTFDRRDAEAFFEANVRLGSEYVGWGDGLEQAFMAGNINDTDYLSIADTSSNIRDAGIGLINFNKTALQYLIQDGVVSSGEVQAMGGRQFNADGSENVFWRTHQDVLLDFAVVQSISVVGVAGYRSSLRGTGGTQDVLPARYTRNADGTINGPGNPGGQRALFRETGEVDTLGNPILQRESGGYFRITSAGTQERIAARDLPQVLQIRGSAPWQQSQAHIQEQVGGGEVSYVNGVVKPHGTPGSVRPDAVSPCGTACYEVKNYDLSSANGQNSLVNTTVTQINQRTTNLPTGMQQKIKIDVTGQNVSLTTRARIVNRIVERSNGAVGPDDINFFTRD